MNIMNLYVYENRSMSSDLSKPIMLENLNVDTIKIHIPQTLGGVNMSTWAWWFVYQNAEREKYSVPLTLEMAENDEGEVEFIATVFLNYGYTGRYGTVSYALEAIRTNDSGKITGEWHTRTYKHDIIYTLQGNQAQYAETEADVISALLNRVNELITSGTEIAEIAATIEAAAETAQDVIDSIPSDYSVLSADVRQQREEMDDITDRVEALESSGGGGGSGGSSTLAGLTDTNISDKEDGQVLTYDGNARKWVNKTPSGASASVWGTKKVLFFGDSIGYGANNDGYSFIDILRERKFFASVHKNCVSGSTSPTLHARLIESEAEIAGADIIYCEYEYNDITGLINGNLTPTTLVSSLDTAINYIRARNATCQIVWMPLTISHFDKVGADNVSYFKTWAETMYPAFAERGINLLPVYDEAAAGHASTDGKHPNTAGHQLIAEHVMQLPLGTSNYSTIISDEQGGGSSDQLVTVLYDGNATINTYQGSNYILLNGISDVPAVGDSYRVTWGSASTMLTAKATTVSGTNYVVIGNPGVVGGTDDDSGLTYVAYKSNATQLQFITTDPTGSIHLKVEKYSVSEATTTSAGLMSAEDKQHLDAVYADYSAMLALI